MEEKNSSIEIIDYSDKSIAVIGDTYILREKLKDAGGKFNKFLKQGDGKVAGWIFSKKRKDEILDLIK